MSRQRHLPSIDTLRRRPTVQALADRYGARAVVDALRGEVADLRARLGARDTGDVRSAEEAAAYLEGRLEQRLADLTAGSLHPVINATGVIVHTNLGRAPLAVAALERIAAAASGYVSLELDLHTGRRGSRDVHAEALLCRLTGAEAAVVANNNAAATLLMLSALASGREVLISRGELVEIGGGFRVPDILRQSGAILREVGTTNRTRAADYAAAAGTRTALILRVHPSNFTVQGFTERPALPDLVQVGRQLGVPVAEDLGSGLLEAAWTRAAGPARQPPPALRAEPTVDASLREGVDVVCFSGDKLLGGPQAGVVAGRRDLLARIRRHPLMRAVRVDKLTYAALEATLGEYVAGRSSATIPVHAMLGRTVDELERRAIAIRDRVADAGSLSVSLADGESTIGGGSAPGERLPTRLIAIADPGRSPDALAAALRAHRPPILARIEDDRVLLDLRTVLPAQDAAVAEALQALAR